MKVSEALDVLEKNRECMRHNGSIECAISRCVGCDFKTSVEEREDARDVAINALRIMYSIEKMTDVKEEIQHE